MDYNSIRRVSKSVRAGNITIGGTSFVSIQSMTNTDTHDVTATFAQIQELSAAGCDIVRLAVPDVSAADTFRLLKEAGVTIPLVADIHFDYKIALAAIAAGADKIRINPGNIGSRDRVREVARAAESAGVPIRIGVNSGSIEKSLLDKYSSPTPRAAVESALSHAEILESVGFSDIVISVKMSDAMETIEANRLLARSADYPIHLGVTEAGGEASGRIKSAVGIGTLLAEGIGDTVRVSLTASPVREIPAARDILASLGLDRRARMNIISCPTCGRTKIDLISLLHDFESAVEREGLRDKPVTVALMGCVVNGPGEAMEADIGIAGGIDDALLFRHGEAVRRIPADKVIEELIDEIRGM